MLRRHRSVEREPGRTRTAYGRGVGIVRETTVLVTGATDGLGRSVATELARRGARVLVHGRSRHRGEDTVRAIRDATGNANVELHLADFSELAQVHRLAAEVARTHPELRVLVNNAGIGTGLPESRSRQESRDGHELRFAVNYLAGFLLTQALLPVLRRNAPARVVNVASLGQSPIDFENVMLTRRYSGSRAYGQSKLAQVMHAFEISQRLPAQEVTANALHPATFMPTKMVLEEVGHTVDTLEAGTAATVRLVLDPALEGVSGRFFDGEAETAVHSQAYDEAARRRLWRLSEELTGGAGG